MIVATRLWRSFLISIGLICVQVVPVLAMTWDNRYFPWFDHLYTGSDSRHSNINIQPFCLKGGDAFRFQSRSIKDEQIISYPELWGHVNLIDVANSIVKTGKSNPLPSDWLWLTELKVEMPSSLEAQGATLSGYLSLTDHVGIGASAVLMKLNGFVSVIPDQDSIDKLQLGNPGNLAMFSQALQKIYHDIEITGTADQQVGVGDVVVYASIFDVQEYKYKFRKLDWGVWLGCIIPSGLKQNPHNLASVGIGGQFGGWAWFIAPRAEFELRDDLKFGIQGRITQRFDHSFVGRIPVGKEQPLFAPLLGAVAVDQGTTFGGSAYFIFEDIRAGLGAQIQYTINHHDRDRFEGCINNNEVKPQFSTMNYYSSWTQEYFTFKLFYDAAHDKSWKTRPIVYFSWDIPMNHSFGRGFAKTHKIAIGCNVNF